MGYDLVFRGSNTKITDVETGCYWKTYNDFVYRDLFTLSSRLNNSWSDGRRLVEEAPILVKDNGSEDFTWDTGIYEYDEIMNLPTNDVNDLLKKMVKEKPKTKYIFIQVF